MKKTGTIKTKVFAGVIAAVCAVSAISTGAIIGASAHSSASAPVIESRTSSSVFTLPMKGVDWNYYADSLDVLVDCEIDFNYNLCNFKFTAVRPGAANITLQTKDTYGVWTNTPIRITVDKNLRMKIVQTGDSTIICDNSQVEDYTAEKNYQIESNEHKDYWMNEYAGTTRQDAVILAESSLGDE